MQDNLGEVVRLVADFGYSFVFLWLFVREMNAHAETRKAHVEDLRKLATNCAEELKQELEAHHG